MNKIFSFLICLTFITLLFGNNYVTTNASTQNNLSLKDCEIIDIAAGNNHNLALDKNGNLWAWGKNDYGQLGDGTTTNSNVPIKIMQGHKFKKISAGYNCSAAIDEDGYLYSWGGSSNPTIPTLVSSTTLYKDVLCNYKDTMAIPITSDIDFYYGYGMYECDCNYVIENTYYHKKEYYLAKYTLSSKIISACGNFSMKSIRDGGEFTYVYYSNSFFVLSTGELKYAYDYSHSGYKNTYSFFFDLNLSIFDDIKLKSVDTRKTIDSNTSTRGTAFFVSQTGDLYSVGYNGSNFLLGNKDNNVISTNTPEKIEEISGITKVSAGENHVLAMDNKGKVYSWGNNAYGQLGVGDLENRQNPTCISKFTQTKSFDLIVFNNQENVGSFAQSGADSYKIQDNPNKGSLVLDSLTGEFTYVPNTNEYGKDTASIIINYSGVELTYQIDIFIDRKPVFIGGTPSFNVECGQAFTGNSPAIDADNDTLIYSIYKAPDKGKVLLNDNNGSFTYVANNDLAGSDTFIIGASDGYITTQYPVSVHIQSLISFNDDTDFNIDLLKTKKYNGNINAKDIDGDELQYSILKDGNKGKVSIDENGNYEYIANDNQYGEDTFIIRINDNYKPLDVTYTVHLYSVSDDATILMNKITKGTTFVGNVKTKCYGTSINYSIMEQPSNGSVNIDNESGEYTYIPNEGSVGDDYFKVIVDYFYGKYVLVIHVYQNTIPNNSDVVTNFVTKENVNYSGTAECVDVDNDYLIYSINKQPIKGNITLNSTTGEYIYYPNKDVAGDDYFEILVNDGVDSIINKISVHIESEIVTKNEINKTISQNTSLSNKIDATDKDGDILSFSIVNSPENGVASIDSVTGEYVYIPFNNYFGNDKFVVKVDDGVNAKLINISIFINRKPIANQIYLEFETKGTAITGTVMCNDPDGDTLTYSLNGQPTQGNVVVNSENGSFAYTPNIDAHGNDIFKIKASDGCDDVLITVKIHNETEVELDLTQKTTIIVNQGKSTNGQVLAIDLDGDELTYEIAEQPTQGNINLNSKTGVWTYYSNTKSKGIDSFSINVTDGNTTKNIKYRLLINSPATFEKDDYSFNTNQSTLYSGMVTAIDLDGDNLEYLITKQGAKGKAIIDKKTGRYTYTPLDNMAGNDSFVIGVSDGNFVTEIEVKVHIESDINVLTKTITKNVQKNSVITGFIDANDPDGDELIFNIDKQGTKGVANIMNDGSYSYFANEGSGNDIFVISITDGIHVSYVTIYVKINTYPVFEESEVTITVPKGERVIGKANCYDEDGDILSYSIYKKPDNGTVNLNSSTGSYAYTSLSNTTKNNDIFIVEASDGNDSCLMVINVLINNPPNAKDSHIVVSQGGKAKEKIDASDPENDQLTYSISSQGKHGNVSINSSTGEYTYILNDKGFFGNDSFVVEITDGYNTKNIIVTIDVTKNNKPKAESCKIELDSGTNISSKIIATDLENDQLTYSISLQGEKGNAYIDEESGEFSYFANKDVSGTDCFVITITDGYNEVSYLVEVDINYVDSNSSWAVPTVTSLGVITSLSIVGMILTFIRNKKRGY